LKKFPVDFPLPGNSLETIPTQTATTAITLYDVVLRVSSAFT